MSFGLDSLCSNSGANLSRDLLCSSAVMAFTSDVIDLATELISLARGLREGFSAMTFPSTAPMLALPS